jgi:hypothetical protein
MINLTLMMYSRARLGLMFFSLNGCECLNFCRRGLILSRVEKITDVYGGELHRRLQLTKTSTHTMVLINLKTTLGSSGSSDDNNSNDEFLYETKLSTKVDDLIESLVNIHNARVRSHFIITTVKGLAMYGVARRIDEDGDEDDDQKVRAASHCPLIL